MAFGLPAGRVYEQVSPAYKGGYGVTGIGLVSVDGDRATFVSLGSFAGAQWYDLEATYLAERVNGVGWVTSSLQPPPTAEEDKFSSGLEYAIAERLAGQTKEGSPGVGVEYLTHQVGAPNTPASWVSFNEMLEPLVDVNGKPTAAAWGASGDLCHLILISGTETALTKQADGSLRQLYDWTRGWGCGGVEGYLRAVAMDNSGHLINPECPVDLGVESRYVRNSSQQEADFNSVSANGDTVFFTTSVEHKGNCEDSQLFARLGGVRTVEISEPSGEACGDVPCPGAVGRPSAYFDGASEDGSQVFFTTHARLVEGDKDSGNNLYMAVLGCGEREAECSVGERRVTSLVQVSHDPVAGQQAGVIGVVRIAPDGSHVYFVAHGVLSEGPNAEGHAPVAGADNLYVYDVKSGRTMFIADLCSGPELSGASTTATCPVSLTGDEGYQYKNDSGLWGTGGQQATSTRDGRVLVFSSYGRLTEDDVDSARDVYRYDSDSELLVRVSAGEDGYGSNGNEEFDASIVPVGILPGDYAESRLELAVRAVTDDGDRIVFSSAGPLSARAVNGLINIYEWQANEDSGTVSLLSGGASLTNDEAATISPSGRDVFFLTAEGLAPGDEDGLGDVYDARIEGPGEALSAPVHGKVSCEGDACQGPLTNPVPLLVPGSTVQQAGENASSRPSTKKKTVAKKRKRYRRKRVRRRDRHSARSRHVRTTGRMR